LGASKHGIQSTNGDLAQDAFNRQTSGIYPAIGTQNHKYIIFLHIPWNMGAETFVCFICMLDWQMLGDNATRTLNQQSLRGKHAGYLLAPKILSERTVSYSVATNTYANYNQQTSQ
jgi:hypothetical protein